MVPRVGAIGVLTGRARGLLMEVELAAGTVLGPRGVCRCGYLANKVALLLRRRVDTVTTGVPPMVPVAITVLRGMWELTGEGPAEEVVDE